MFTNLTHKNNLQLFLVPKLVVTLIKKLVIHLHEQFDSVVDEPVNRLVPMCLWVVVECREHDRKDHRGIFCDQRHDVVIVPVVKSTFGDLKVWRADALGDLCEERNHHLLELCRLDDVEDFFELVEEHDFFRAVRLRPVFEEAPGRKIVINPLKTVGNSKKNSLDDRLRQTWIFFEELHDAVRQLWMVHRQTLDLVQRQQGFQ